MLCSSWCGFIHVITRCRQQTKHHGSLDYILLCAIIALLVFLFFENPGLVSDPSVESELTPEIGHLFWVRQIRSCQHRNWQAWPDFKIKWLFSFKGFCASTTFPTSVHQKIYSVMANHWLVVGRCWNGFSIMAADLIRRPEQTGVGNIDLTYRQLIKISDLTKMKFKSNIDLTFYQLSCKSQI